MRPSESQLILPGMPVAPVTPASWLGVKGTRGAGRYRNHRWILFTDQGQPSGFQVFHCGHPTATYPYYAEFNGEPLPGFKTFRHLETAQAHCEQLQKERVAAGVVLEKSVTTPMGDDLLEQYKG